MRPDAPSPRAPRARRSIALPDRYRVRRHIATGGMASVWCAEDLVLGRSVAVKILAERFAHDQVANARFQREARAAARVANHAHVVTVYDIGELDPDGDAERGRAFIVMEYLAGGTVADALHHDAVRRREAMRWLGEAAAALDHAHGRGIVHRDIKPANFLLDRQRVLHVADFGIARLTTEDTITTSDQLFGTAAYLSPEQALGREATGASDRYALAVAAFELLVGERPFSAPHFSTQARQHIEEPPPAASGLNRTLPPAVDEVLFAGLAKDPGDRPATAGELVQTLEIALSAPQSGARCRRAAAVRHPEPAATAATAAGVAAASTTAARRSRPAPDTRAPRAPAADGTPPHTRHPVGAAAASPPDPSRPRRRRVVALASLAVAIAVIAGIALAATVGSSSRRTPTRAAARTVTRTTIRHVSPARHTAPRPATTASATTPTATVPAAPPTAAQLQSTGHAEMVAGDYTTAIPTLRRAVASSPDGSLTHAYALYDLGYSMVHSGEPAAAIPVLQERLKTPNQTGVVQHLLDEAYAAAHGHGTSDGAVAQTTSTTQSPTPPSGGPGDSGPSGGAGIAPHTSGPGHAGGDRGGPGENPQARHGHGHHGGGGSIVQLLTAAAG